MAAEPLAQKVYWLQQQINGAIIFIVLGVVFVALSLLATALRLRDGKRAFMGANVILVIAGLLSFLPLCVVAIVNANAYKGYFRSQEKSDQVRYLVTVLKTVYIFSVIYPIACVLPKLSICCLYLELFKGVHTRASWITKALILFLIVNAIAWFVPLVLICRPIAQYWNPNSPQRRCMNFDVLGTWITLPNIVSDLVILVLPMPVIWKLQMRFPKKVGIMLTFLAGSHGIIAACLRLALHYAHQKAVGRLGDSETTKSIVLDMMCSFFEPGSYLIAACFPSLRIIFAKLHTTLSDIYASFRRSRRGYTSFPNNSLKNQNSREGIPAPNINIKLTGAGNLESLQRAEEEFRLDTAASARE